MKDFEHPHVKTLEERTEKVKRMRSNALKEKYDHKVLQAKAVLLEIELRILKLTSY